MADETTALGLKELKRDIKAWEAQFLAEHGNKPEKADIAREPAIAKKYKQYAKLKKAEATGTSPSTGPVDVARFSPALAEPAGLYPPDRASASPPRQEVPALPRDPSAKATLVAESPATMAATSRAPNDWVVNPLLALAPPLPQDEGPVYTTSTHRGFGKAGTLATYRSISQAAPSPLLDGVGTVVEVDEFLNRRKARPSVEGASAAGGSSESTEGVERAPDASGASSVRVVTYTPTSGPAAPLPGPRASTNAPSMPVRAPLPSPPVRAPIATETAESRPFPLKQAFQPGSTPPPPDPEAGIAEGRASPLPELAPPEMPSASAPAAVAAAPVAKAAPPAPLPASPPTPPPAAGAELKFIEVDAPAPTPSAPAVRRASRSLPDPPAPAAVPAAVTVKSLVVEGATTTLTQANSKAEPAEDDDDSNKEQAGGATEEEEELDPPDNQVATVPIASPAGATPTSPSKASGLKPLATPDLSWFKRLPPGGILRCKLYRKKNLLDKSHPSFFLYNEADEKFLLSARKRKKSKDVNYLISTSLDDLSKESQHYVAKIKANSQRTAFTILDARTYNKQAEGKGLVELACVNYTKNCLPREILVAIHNPALDLHADRDKLSRDIMSDLKIRDTNKISILKNKPPRWNEVTQSHCLNFGGRVTQPSIKNFQLIAEGSESVIILQFGRCGPDFFTVDLQWPLTPVEGFAIALTTFDAYDNA